MGQQELSAAETELYDRQIRLWGIESQAKLRAANVLLIGIRSLGSEIAKNILLAGINSLTILDDGLVTEDDTIHNFLLNEKVAIGNKIAEEVLLRAQALNPLVTITADTESLASKPPEYFKAFTIVVATKIKVDNVIEIDGICRENNVKFIYGDVFGFFGFSTSDLLEHDYYEDRIQLTTGRKRGHDGEKKTVKIKGSLSYPSLNKVLILPNFTKDSIEIKKIIRPTSLFPCMLTLLEFRKRLDRDPSYETKEQDLETLKSIAAEVIELYNLSNMNLEKLYELLFDDLAPVSAILGGVIAQEVIKAVSHKEVTINNVFLFDPITLSGKEVTVGV